MPTQPKSASAAVTVAVSVALILVGCAASPPSSPASNAEDATEVQSEAESETTEKEAAGEASAEQPAPSKPAIGPLAAPGATFRLSTELDDPDPQASPNCQEARALLEQAFELQSDVFAITVTFVDGNEQRLKERFMKKMNLAEKAQHMLEEVIKTNCPEWASAAQFHIGLQHANFAETMAASGVPSKLSEEQAKIYCGLLMDRARKLYGKATAAWKQTVEAGKEKDVRTTWTEKAAEHLEAGAFDKQTEVDACVEQDREIRTRRGAS